MAKATSVVIAKKDTKSSKSPSALHPPYSQMIVEAITALKESNGSSQPAIAKAIEERHKKELSPNFKKSLSAQLKTLVESKSLVKVKNSYKLLGVKKPKKAAKKMKRLSQVKTPEAMKKKPKTLSEAKSPVVSKRKIEKPINSPRPKKKAKK